MATSASSSQVPQKKYDVFISFGGLDVRHGFLSHLTNELRQKEINVFVEERLKLGDETSPVVEKAIEASLISLVIFSRHYASSVWCLEELVKIMECKEVNGQIVIPIFYNVDPSDVRHQKGIYANAFAQHKWKFEDNIDKLQIWNYTLVKATNLYGYLSSNHQKESELIDGIVKDVLKKLDSIKQKSLVEFDIHGTRGPRGMDTSTSSSQVPREKYVYINFRGSDTRHEFLSYWTKAFHQKGINVFVDEKLNIGEEISPALLKAIEGSLISLVIFSKNYASSTWCLEELVKIMECMQANGQIVIPVFYNIDPSDVRYLKGTYAKAFAHLEWNYNEDKLQIWRSTLVNAANLSGYYHASNVEDEAELIDGIVEGVSKKLDSIKPKCHVEFGIHGTRGPRASLSLRDASWGALFWLLMHLAHVQYLQCFPSQFWKYLGALASIFGLLCFMKSYVFTLAREDRDLLLLIPVFLLGFWMVPIAWFAEKIPLPKAHWKRYILVLTVLITTTLYSNRLDQVLSGRKPDAWIIMANGFFALAMLFISMKLQHHFETGFFMFFLGLMFVLLTKNSWLLFFPGAVICYFLMYIHGLSFSKDD